MHSDVVAQVSRFLNVRLSGGSGDPERSVSLDTIVREESYSRRERLDGDLIII